jgi:predicted lipid carrier protein YhbT
VVDAAYWFEAEGAGGGAGSGAAAFAREDLPRLLRAVARPDTLVLLPARAAAAVRAELERSGDAAGLAAHIVEQEEGADALYFARHVYVHACKCS